MCLTVLRECGAKPAECSFKCSFGKCVREYQSVPGITLNLCKLILWNRGRVWVTAQKLEARAGEPEIRVANSISEHRFSNPSASLSLWRAAGWIRAGLLSQRDRKRGSAFSKQEDMAWCHANKVTTYEKRSNGWSHYPWWGKWQWWNQSGEAAVWSAAAVPVNRTLNHFMICII